MKDEENKKKKRQDVMSCWRKKGNDERRVERQG